MKIISQTELLDIKILELKKKQQIELQELKDQFGVVKESFSPSSLMVEGVTGLYNTAFNKANLMNLATSVASGFISKKLVVGNSDSTFKKILGSVVQFSLTNFLSKFKKNKHEEDN